MGSGIESGAIADFLAAHKPVSTGESVVPGAVFGDWRVTAFLGRGGSGEVYRVVHTTLGTAAALKVCVKNPERDASRDEAVCARFRREAKLLAEHKHPAFPCFRGFGELEGRPWYVMELLEHRPLPSAEREIVRFLLAIASGVQHLHSQGIIHRDIKPGNILWRRTGRAECPHTAAAAREDTRHPAFVSCGHLWQLRLATHLYQTLICPLFASIFASTD